MNARRRALIPRSWGLSSFRSVSLSTISMLTSFIASVVGWSGLNRVDKTILSYAWSPHARGRVAGRETQSGAVRVATPARESVALPLAMP